MKMLLFMYENVAVYVWKCGCLYFQVQSDFDAMDPEELKRHLEAIQKEAKQYKQQLLEKAKEAESYKRKLTELEKKWEKME